jgi:SNF2 family DNA or RNA helicase
MHSKPSSTKPIKPLWANFQYFEHQDVGIRWMLDKEINGVDAPTRDGKSTVKVYGGFQCDDMGLGKTIQICSIILNNPKPLTLLLAPLAMIDTWSQVVQRAGLIVYQYDSKLGGWKCCNPPPPTTAGFFAAAKPRVYISNYEKLSRSPSQFKHPWNRVVLDEAHKIRNGDGEMAKQARKLTMAPGGSRWAVTGTPLVNSLKDVVSLLAFIGVPYSPLWRWEPRYIELLPHIMLNRSLNELRSVIKDAPPIPDVIQKVLPFATKQEEDFYLGIQGAIESKLKKYSRDLLSPQEAFKLLLRLRQISVHPQVYINAKRREEGDYPRNDWTLPATKLEEIKKIISSDDESTAPHKYLVFCQFEDEMNIIKADLLNNGINCVETYNGSMNQGQRALALKTVKESEETTVLLIQLQAGGVGLNLQEFDRIIFISPWWTSALMDQAIARAVRMGQKKVVKVYHLMLATEHESSVNIDSIIEAKAHEKRIMLEKLFTHRAEL